MTERLVGRLLIEEFRNRHATRDEGEEWFAWIFWIGLSPNVPLAVLEALGELIRAMGFATERTTLLPSKHGFEPLLYLGDEGLELLRMI